MVLILSDRFDTHADLVVGKLDQRTIPYYRLNLDIGSLLNTKISFQGGKWTISATNSATLHSDDISCVWCRRPFVELTLEEQQRSDVDFKIWKNEWNKTLLGLYNSLKNLPWLNPLRKAYKGENKYYQMELANEIGFLQPDTIISNDKAELLQFADAHKQVILKLMAQEIYDIGNCEFRGFYTNLISKSDLIGFGDSDENPIVLQAYVEKKYEVRYTVVGERHFACMIDSQKSEQAKYDWRRYDIPHTPHYGITPPAEIKTKVASMLERLQLSFGAFDFVVTPKDEWYFLEVNCMGQWLWIEQLASLPISDAIVEWINKYI